MSRPDWEPRHGTANCREPAAAVIAVAVQGSESLQAALRGGQRGLVGRRREGEVRHAVHGQRLERQDDPLEGRVEHLRRRVLREGVVEVRRGVQPAGQNSALSRESPEHIRHAPICPHKQKCCSPAGVQCDPQTTGVAYQNWRLLAVNSAIHHLSAAAVVTCLVAAGSGGI